MSQHAAINSGILLRNRQHIRLRLLANPLPTYIIIYGRSQINMPLYQHLLLNLLVYAISSKGIVRVLHSSHEGQEMFRFVRPVSSLKSNAFAAELSITDFRQHNVLRKNKKNIKDL